MRRKKFLKVENASFEEKFESHAFLEMKNIESSSNQMERKKRQLISSISNQLPNSMLLEGKFVDIHETNALEPDDFGIDDMPYIDDD